MSIKMICSDLDGTLLQYGRKTLEPEVFTLIEQLADRGILFARLRGGSTPARKNCLRR